MARGGILFFFRLLSLSFFSFCLLLRNKLSFFWLFMELCTLRLVPSFFISYNRYSLGGLFRYLIVSSVASSFIVSGVLIENFLFMSLIGFFIKFGIFPFFGWVYSVMLGTKLFVV